MKKVHLLGHPVSQSHSPLMQNTAFQTLGLDWEYSALDILPSGLISALEGLEADPQVVGCNVTVPHKIAAFEWLERQQRVLHPHAARAGAVNTLFRGPDGLFRGTSTDFQGAMNAVLSALPHDSTRSPEIVILGTGGSAQTLAVGFAATEQLPGHRTISVYGRNRQKALAIVELAQKHAVKACTLKAMLLEDFAPSPNPRIVCQTTTVGMATGEAPDQSPVAAGLVGTGDLAFDLVYKPHWTPFLREARDHGAQIVHGIHMLIGQGAQSLVHWLDAQDAEVSHASLGPEICVSMANALRAKGVF